MNNTAGSEINACLREAYVEALSAAGNSDPNPAVGAILLDRNGQRLSAGHTQSAGHAHAERMALRDLSAEQTQGGTLFVTLEPCCHHGRTPPCTDIILEKKIARVVIGERDFAAEVRGQSIDLLRHHSIDAILADQADLRLPQLLTTGPFFFSRRHRRPRVLLKWAQTLDGFVAPESGTSGKISGEMAALVTATLRSFCKLTLATPGTVASDRPRLDIRFPRTLPDLSATGLSPYLRELVRRQWLMHESRGTGTDWKEPVRAYLTGVLDAQERASLTQFQATLGNGFHLFEREAQALRQHFSETITQVLAEIHALGFNSVLVEAGPRMAQAFIEAGLADLLVVYRSKHRTAKQLWGSAGRTHDMARQLANNAPPQLTGYSLIEATDLISDEMLFFERQ